MRIDPKIIIFVLLAAFILSAGFTVQKISALPEFLKSDLHVEQQHLHKIDTPISKMMWMSIISGVLGAMTMGLIVYRNKYVINKNKYRPLAENDLIVPKAEESEKHSTTEDDKETELRQRVELITKEINSIGSSQKDVKKFANAIISTIAKHFEASQGVFYCTVEEKGKHYLELRGGYAYFKPDDGETKTLFGIGLAGQVAKAKQPVNIDHIPDGYIDIISGLGQATPSTLIIFPLLVGDNTIGVIEFASFKKFSQAEEQALLKIGEQIATFTEPLISPKSKSTSPKIDKPDS